jgi:hypothetical protein
MAVKDRLKPVNLKTAANRVTFSVLAQLGGLECNGLQKRALLRSHHQDGLIWTKE